MLEFLNYSTGQKSLCEDGVYYLEEKIEGGALAILSANFADQLGDLPGVTILNSLTAQLAEPRKRSALKISDADPGAGKVALAHEAPKNSLLLAILEEGMEPESDCAVKRARGSFAGHLS